MECANLPFLFFCSHHRDDYSSYTYRTMVVHHGASYNILDWLCSSISTFCFMLFIIWTHSSSDVRNFLLASHAHCLWIFGIHVSALFGRLGASNIWTAQHVKFLGVPLGQCSCLVCSHRLALWNDPLPNPILHRRLSRIPHYTSRRRYPNHCLFEYHLRSRSTLLPSIPHHRTFRVPPIHCGQLAYRIVRHRAENQFRSTSCQGSHVTTIFYGHKKRHRASPCRA